ncbi:MAG: ethanolamine ammonia-lyase subunit EutB [Tepidanaerobacteraceae bacterium]|jgi:ethanolamine ammonia-lyase large subunit|nr:ethanolamine ammonia-lyase subunit EutB [Tepidanaerobacter sp.]
MPWTTRLFGKHYTFFSIKEILAKASEEKSGDVFAKIAAESNEERIAAKRVLAELTLKELRENPVIPYEEDEVTRVIDDGLCKGVYNSISHMTVAEFREWLLSHGTAGEDIRRISVGLTAEMVSAVAKLMSNMDLVYAASKIRVVTKNRTEIGLPGTLSYRIQPNHPADSVEGILASVMEGLSYGSGDAVIGINPNEDTVENTIKLLNATYDFIMEWAIPTQNCVLSHVTTQMKAVEKGAKACMFFQSIAGSESCNKVFGVSASILDEALDLIKREGYAAGPNLMYFETGQGSELSLESHHGADMQTLEARTYGFGRRYMPFMVNNVSGFIGPETLYDGKQIIRASLEDHFMGKLIGLPMGMAPCYTNHVKVDQNDQENAIMLLAMAGANYYMGVPGSDDCMLSYQDTSYHDDATLRELLGLRPAPEFEKWLEDMGIMKDGKLTEIAGDPSLFSKITPPGRR